MRDWFICLCSALPSYLHLSPIGGFRRNETNTNTLPPFGLYSDGRPRNCVRQYCCNKTTGRDKLTGASQRHFVVLRCRVRRRSASPTVKLDTLSLQRGQDDTL